MNKARESTLILLAAFLACCQSAAAAGERELPPELRHPEMFCEGCYGVVSEVAEMMAESAGSGKAIQARIDGALGSVCHTDNLRKYVFSPPKMVKVCEAMLRTFRMTLTNVFREEFRGGKKPETSDLVRKACREATTACAEGKEIPSEKRQKAEEERKKKSEL